VLSNSDYSSDSGKFDDITSQISTIVKSGHKLLIFSSFLKHLNIISSWLEKNEVSYVSLTGQMSSDERQKSVTSFQQDGGVQVFLLSIKAGGTGLNLTQADYIFILEPWWNPFVEKQAVARAHRIGRKKPVIVKRFITKDSIEEKILNLQKSKVEISGQIIESDDPVFLDNTDLEQLLE
jgi:non-specific serine/threonine protein kinase